MILIITDKSRLNTWADDLLLLDKKNLRDDQFQVAAIQAGYKVWESQIWDAALIDGVELNPDQYNVLQIMARKIFQLARKQ